MSTEKDGGPAFPFPVLHGNSSPTGMSLRDYFAAMAMQGMVANGDWVTRMSRQHGKSPDVCVSGAAYEVVDAMLAAREA